MKKFSVLFLHGALGTSTDLAPLMRLVELAGHEVLALDFSGHGKNTSWPNEFRIDLFARELDSFLAKNPREHLAIVGHSMGGYVALYHVAHFENSPICHIFTYGTKFNWSPETVAKELPFLNPEALEQRFPEKAQFLKEKHGERWKQLMRATAHMIQNLEKLDGLAKEDLADISIPITLMLGDQDKMVTTEETHTAKSALKEANLKTISNSKHDLERANLKEIATVILKTLD